MTLAILCLLHLSLGTPAIAVSVAGTVETQINATRVRVARFDEIPAGATIITGAKSTAQLRLASGSLLRIGPDSRLALTTLEHNSPAGRRKESVRLVVGRLWARVTDLFGGDSKFEVETANAVAGVRGTSFIVEAEGSSNRFVLLSGALNLLRDGAGLNLDHPGAFVAASSGEGFGKPGTLDSDALSQLQRSIGGPGVAMIEVLAAKKAAIGAPAAAGGRGTTRLDIVGPTGFVDSGVGPDAPPTGPGDAIIDVQITVDQHRGAAN